jgi:hypothetical protein
VSQHLKGGVNVPTFRLLQNLELMICSKNNVPRTFHRDVMTQEVIRDEILRQL